jgi:hypothetical protein
VQVENEFEYDLVNVYLIPDKLPSYQKMNKKGVTYSESLNELFDYDLVCLAKKGSDYYYYTDLLQKKDDTKAVTLRSIDKKELNKLLKSMNKKSANRNISEDLEYEEENLLYNQNLEKRKKDEAFRREVEGVIWPCGAETVSPEPLENIEIPSLLEFVQLKDSSDTFTPIAFKLDTFSIVPQKPSTERVTPTTFAKQTELQNYLKTEYPDFFKKLAQDFNLDDPTFHASFSVICCNLKKTPFITASNAEKTEQYEVDMSKKGNKVRERKKFFKLCAADCGGSLASNSSLL